MITIVKKVEEAIIAPFPRIMMIHPMTPAELNLPMFLKIRKKALMAEGQKSVQ